MLANGVVLTGNIEEGDLVSGKIEYPDGTVKEGKFKDWKLHGYGMITFKDGKSFRGEFHDD